MDEETYRRKIAKANVESAANARKQAAEGSTESENNDGGVATQRSLIPKQPTSSTSSADEKDYVATTEYSNIVDKTIKELRGDTDKITMNPDRFEAKEISHAISASINDEAILQVDNENVTIPRNASKSGQIPNEDNSQQYRYQLNIKVPPGKLGLLLVRRPTGQRLTVVGGCKKDSPLYGKIPPGSRLMAVDGDDTSRMTVSEITKMFKKKNCERMLTFASTSTFRINSLSSFDEDEEFQDFQRESVASENITAALSASTIAQASSTETMPENLPYTSDVASSSIVGQKKTKGK